VQFVAGFYEETLQIDQPVALAHIDCDWHDSVMTCLERIEPHLVKGGLLIIDDYDEWSGCKRAVDSYFANRKDEFDFILKSRLHIVRK
jgi:asparagine synthase (glutamine-hydrolysing)